MPGTPGRSGGTNSKTAVIRSEVITAADPPPGLSTTAKAVWDSVVGCGLTVQSDLPLLVDAMKWYSRYEAAAELLDKDPLDRDARISATASYKMFIEGLRVVGVAPCVVKKTPETESERHDREMRQEAEHDAARMQAEEERRERFGLAI